MTTDSVLLPGYTCNRKYVKRNERGNYPMTTVSITTATNSEPRLRGFALISVITALMLTLLLEALDQTIVGTAMPRIIAEPHGLDRYTSFVTAYVLATITLIPIVGNLSDPF